MLNKIINILTNQILFYKDNNEYSIFRNYCIAKHTACLYRKNITKSEAGKVLEYKIGLDKKLKTAYILITVLIYFLFIHSKYSLFSILWYEFLWIFLVSFCRLKASDLYNRILIKNFGEYELAEFHPDISREKQKQFISSFYFKICTVLICITLFILPAFIINSCINLAIRSKKPHIKIADSLSKIYLTFYPKTQKLYDIKALVSYKNNDLEGAVENYKLLLEMNGKNFSQKDYTRFANMLFIEKQIKSPAQALDTFNDYMTRKNMSVLEKSKMLWIKSIFSIENHISEGVIQDYNDMLLSLNPKDEKNKFYIESDKAYMLYLMNDYKEAIELYNSLIQFAQNKKEYANSLKSLHAERGFARYKIGDTYGANKDFINSKIPFDEINSYEPSFLPQQFITEKF